MLYLKAGDFTLTPLEWWKSGATAGNYPIRWRIEIPRLKMRHRGLDAAEKPGAGAALAGLLGGAHPRDGERGRRAGHGPRLPGADGIQRGADGDRAALIFPYPRGYFTCHAQALSMIFPIDSNFAAQPSSRLIFSDARSTAADRLAGAVFPPREYSAVTFYKPRSPPARWSLPRCPDYKKRSFDSQRQDVRLRQIDNVDMVADSLPSRRLVIDAIDFHMRLLPAPPLTIFGNR